MKLLLSLIFLVISIFFYSCSDELSPLLNKSDGSISGYLSTPETTPIKNAIVVLNSNDTLFSDNNGFFMFKNLESGLYYINIYADGYEDTTIQNISVDGSSETPLSIIELKKKDNGSEQLSPILVTYNVVDFTLTDVVDAGLSFDCDTVLSQIQDINISDSKITFVTTPGTHTIHIKYFDFIDTTFTDNITNEFNHLYTKKIPLYGEKSDPSILSFSASLENNKISLDTPAKVYLQLTTSKNDISKIVFDFDGDGIYESILHSWSLEKLYTYSKTGDYTISIKLFDNQGYSASQTLNISVE